MTDQWYVVLRDLLIILAALATILAAGFASIVFWRLYRLAREIRAQLEPIVASVDRTAATLRDSSAFVKRSRVPAPVTTIGLLMAGIRFLRLVRSLRGHAASEGRESP